MEVKVPHLVYSLTVCSTSSLLGRRGITTRCLATVFIITATLLTMTPCVQGTGDDDTPCVECRQQQVLAEVGESQGEDAIVAMHKDLIKRKILQSLGMSQPPNITGLVRPPPPAIRRQFERERRRIQEEEGLVGNMEQLFGGSRRRRHRRHGTKEADSKAYLVAKQMSDCSSSDLSCVQFDLTSAVRESEEFISAELMVFSEGHSSHETHALEISPLGHDGRHHTRHRALSRRRGWVGVDVSGIVRRWLISREDQGAVQFKCPSCSQDKVPITTEDGDHQAYLIISTLRVALPDQRRTKRHTDSCALHPLTVNFRDEGWDFIFEPNEFQPNYCAGSCGARNHHLATQRHGTMMQHFGRNHRRPDVLPCCSPTEYGSLSVNYITKEGVHRSERMNGMIAKRCGCS